MNNTNHIFITDNWVLLTVHVFLVSNLMRRPTQQYLLHFREQNSGAPRRQRYGFLQWHIIASEKLKFSSPTSFPLNTKRMSAYIWQHRLCIRFFFFSPLPCCFRAFIFLPELWGRSSEEGSKTILLTLGEYRSLLHRHAYRYSLQMWAHDAFRLTPMLAQRLNAVL